VLRLSVDGYPPPVPPARLARVRTVQMRLMALAALTCAWPAQAQEPAAWQELRSANFIVVGDAARDDLCRAIDDLEAFRSALATFYPGIRTGASVPARVVVFQDGREFQRFLPRDEHGRPVPNVAAFFLPSPDLDLIVLTASGKTLDRRAVLHEYAHHMVRRSVHALPLWLNEGLAEFYSTFDHESNLAPAILGRPPGDMIAALRGSDFVRLHKIVDPRTPADLLKDGERARLFYAESWALVHYLLIGRPGASNAQLTALIDALTRAVPPNEAFASVYGVSLGQLENELRAYVRRQTFQGVPLDPGSEGSRVAAAARVMSDAAVGRLRGEILLRVGTVGEAQRELAASLAVEPENLDARIAMARVLIATGRRGDGRAALQAIAAEAPASFAAQYYLGGALSLERKYEAAFIAFDSAVRARDSSIHALFAFSTAALAVGLDDASEAAMQRLIELEFNPDVYRTRAYAALGLRRDAAAATDARRYIDAVGWREPSAQAVAFIAVIAYWRSHRAEDAAVLLEQVRAAVSSSSWPGAVAQYLQGKLTAERLLSRARDPRQKTAAHTYIGLKATLEGRREEALEHLRWVRAEGTRAELGFAVAIEELVRIEAERR
jgi:thioredoxin-like negative regulator of GroEL